MTERKALDVWFRFRAEDTMDPEGYTTALEAGEEESTAEANTYALDGGGYIVEWYLNAVGLVRTRYFPEYEDARRWLESEGFADYSPGE